MVDEPKQPQAPFPPTTIPPVEQARPGSAEALRDPASARAHAVSGHNGIDPSNPATYPSATPVPYQSFPPPTPTPMSSPLPPPPMTTMVPEIKETHITKEGYKQQTITYGDGIDIISRHPTTDKSAADRDRRSDSHHEFRDTRTGETYVGSSVSGIKHGGETYTVSVASSTDKSEKDHQSLGIAREGGGFAVLRGDALSDKMKAQIHEAVSPKGDGGTALTYNEAKNILENALSPAKTPVEPPTPGKKGRGQGE